MGVQGDGVGPVHAGQLDHEVVAQLGLDEHCGLPEHSLLAYVLIK